MTSRGAPAQPGTASRRQVPPEIARSWLLVSARRRDGFERVQHSRADQVVLDVEDAVDPTQKASARGSRTSRA